MTRSHVAHPASRKARLWLAATALAWLSPFAAARAVEPTTPPADSPAATPSMTSPATTPTTEPARSPSAGEVAPMPASRAMGVLGVTVAGPEGHSIGRLVDVLVDSSGVPQAAVIDFGGFMGVGARKIAVHWIALHFAPTDQKRPVTLNMTADQIKAAPEYKEPAQAVPVVIPLPPGRTSGTSPAARVTSPAPAAAAATPPAAPSTAPAQQATGATVTSETAAGAADTPEATTGSKPSSEQDADQKAASPPPADSTAASPSVPNPPTGGR